MAWSGDVVPTDFFSLFLIFFLKIFMVNIIKQ
jgi:hypothetical protein